MSLGFRISGYVRDSISIPSTLRQVSYGLETPPPRVTACGSTFVLPVLGGMIAECFRVPYTCLP